MPALDHIWILLLFPLAGSAITGLFGKRWAHSLVNTLTIGSVALAFLGTLELAREFFSEPASYFPVVRTFLPWISAGQFRVNFSFQFDQLTLLMLLIVTGVGLLIHIYSTGYMGHDDGYYRFFSYMNLFMFFMMILVTAGNLALLFVGWEGVGLCSYLLIGFFFTKKSAADAGKKAFIVTRIGDMGFTIGLLLLFWMFRSLDYTVIFAHAAWMPVELPGHVGVLTTIGLLLFAGAVGKSAQLPLYVWLPDAMEGPTPVSALIHAATMVTAGVYMLARMNFLYAHAPVALFTVAVIGALTAFYAATIALVQTDIKKVLAYSTISQLGYMFLGCGVGAFSAGVFHLMTHAFFKGLLFLAAGSVIHAMGGEQDMRNMGGLRKKIPWTYATMLAATLAIAGIPFFSGFFSKDSILAAAAIGPHPHRILWALGLAGALLTSFYMFRLLFLTFHGEPRYDEHTVHVHESPFSMTGPLVILAIFSVGGGWWALPKLFGGRDYFSDFLSPVFNASQRLMAATQGAGVAEEVGTNFATDLLRVFWQPAVAVALLGLLIAWWFYIARPDTPRRVAEAMRGLYKLLLHKYYVDEIYGAVIVSPLLWVSRNVLWHTVDERVLDGAVNGTGSAAKSAGGQLRRLQSGNARSYATWVVIGAVAVTTLFIWTMVRQ
jgi:NADH-quinone oxidoreductase subunit L